MEGLGDIVAAATQAMGIKPCPPCKKRQEFLNHVFPFRPSSLQATQPGMLILAKPGGRKRLI